MYGANAEMLMPVSPAASRMILSPIVPVVSPAAWISPVQMLVHDFQDERGDRDDHERAEYRLARAECGSG